MKEETKVVNEVTVVDGIGTEKTDTSINAKKLGIAAGVAAGVVIVVGGIKKLPSIIKKSKAKRSAKKLEKSIAFVQKSGYTVLPKTDELFGDDISDADKE